MDIAIHLLNHQGKDVKTDLCAIFGSIVIYTFRNITNTGRLFLKVKAFDPGL